MPFLTPLRTLLSSGVRAGPPAWTTTALNTVIAPDGIPFKAGKPTYSAALAASGDYAGDPSPVITVQARDASSTGSAAPDPATFGSGGDAVWYVTDNGDYTGIANGTTYLDMDALVTAVDAVQSGTIIVDQSSGFSCVDRILNRALDNHVIVRYPVDGSGLWGAFIESVADASNIIALDDGGSTSGWIDVRNARLGLLDANVSAATDLFGTDLVLMRTDAVGRVTLRNCKVWRSKGDGISVQNDSDFIKWTNDARLELFDVEIEYCGSGLGHNAYIHAVNLFLAVRLFSHSSSAVHCLKLDCAAAVCYDCDLKMDHTGGRSGVSTNRPLNITHTTDLYHELCVGDWTPNNDSKNFGEHVHRNDQFGGLSPKVPAVVLGLEPGTATSVSADNYLTFIESGGAKSQHYAGALNAGYSAGVSQIVIKRVDGEWHKDGNDGDLSGNADTWDIQIQKDAGGWFSHTGTVNTASAGSATFDLNETLANAVSVNNYVRFKITTNDWDRPADLNPALYNPRDPDYFWPQIKTGGVLDYAKRAKFPVAHYHNCFFYARNSGNEAQSRLLDMTGSIFTGHWRTSNQPAAFPPGPLNNPAGATGIWPDDADNGDWDGSVSASANYPIGASEPTATDWIHFSPLVLGNIGYYAASNDLDGQIRLEQSGGFSLGLTAVKSWRVDGTGALVDFGGDVSAANVDATPVTLVQFTITAGASAAATALTVNDTTGMTAGDVVLILADVDNSSNRVGGRLHATTVASIGGGTTLNITDGLRHAASNGDVGCVITNGSGPMPETVDSFYASIGGLGSLTTDNDVQRWDARVGFGTFAQGTAGNRPQIDTNDVDGLPLIRSDGTEHLTYTPTATLRTIAATIYDYGSGNPRRVLAIDTDAVTDKPALEIYIAEVTS